MSKLPTHAKKTSKPFYRLHKKIVSRAPCGIRKVRRRNKSRMRDCLSGIMNRKVFKQFFAIAMGRRPEVEHPREDNGSSGNDADVESTQGLMASYSSPDIGEPMSRDTTPSEHASAPLPIEDSPADEPARYLNIFTHPDKNNSPTSSMSLTKTFVWQLNTILRCDNKLQRYASEIATLNSQLHELTDMLSELQDQLSRVPPNEDASEELQNLHYAKDLAADLESQREVLVGKITATEEEMRSPKKTMFRNLKEALERGNLLEDISGNSDDGHVPWNQAPIPTTAPAKRPTPTPSEAEQYALEDAQRDIRELKLQKEVKLQDARKRIEHWGDYYEEEYRGFRELLDNGEGGVGTSKTEFDVGMLGKQREAMRELVEAEGEFEDVVRRARGLGVVFFDEEQGSGFLDHADDGYRVSLERDLVGGVDRVRIERWMVEAGEDKGDGDYEGECDEWESRTVGLGDSVSVVAEGKDKARIERWRALCEECRVLSPVGLEVEEAGG